MKIHPRHFSRFIRQLAALALGALQYVSSHAADANDPATELASLRILDGFSANLFASELDGVVKPIQLRFDSRGRLWVIGSTVYPQIEPGQIPNDKIVVLEDSNGDGKADRSSVFAEGLFIPTGIELGDGGVYVGQGTELLFLKDSNGDGKADERRVVLRGFGTGDAHQTINSFTWGPGGELLMCQGLHAFSRVETPYGLETLNSAGVWRVRPRLLRMDPFWNHEMGPQNPFGVAFDRWGAPIVLAGNGQGVYYLTPAMIRAENRLPMPPLWNTGRKFGGGDFVENSHFPPESQGELITGSYLNNAVYRFRLTEEGSGFVCKDLPPLITSTNLSFRIVDVRFGPDGALYLCDWYNPVIGHYQASFRHPDRDKTHGRIWRVTANGRALVPRPSLGAATIPALLDQLKSTERWNRQLAKRELSERPTDEVLKALPIWLNALDAKAPSYAHHLVEAIGVYETLETPAPALLQKLLLLPEPRARAYAARVLSRWYPEMTDSIGLLKELAADASPRVRLETVVAASYFKDPKAVEAATQVLKQPMDRFLEYALTQTIHTLKPRWLEAFASGALTFGNDARQLQYFVNTDRSADTLGAVNLQLGNSTLPVEARENLLRVLTEIGDADEFARLLDTKTYEIKEVYDAGLHARLLAKLVGVARFRATRPAGDFQGALDSLVASTNLTVRAAAIRLAGAWHLASSLNGLVTLLKAPEQADKIRAAAASALGDYTNQVARAALQASANGETQPEVLTAAIIALAQADPSAAARAAGKLFADPKFESRWNELFLAFLQRKGGGRILADALATQHPSVKAAELGLRLLSGTGRRDELLAGILTKSAGLSMLGANLTAGDAAALAAEVRARGDAKRGAAVYQRPELNCAACHAISGVGGTVGPDLGALGSAQTIEFILESVLLPNQAVKEGFVATEITLKDGDELQGYLVRETADTVILRDALRNREVTNRKTQIQTRRQLGSLMPSGLADTLTRAEFIDLIRYLSELGRIPQ